jgi:hypothetical protein
MMKKPTLHQLELRLKQQEMNTRETAQAICHTMREIGVAYMASFSYSKAEYFFRRSLRLLRTSRHTDEDLIIDTSLHIFDAIRYQGRCREAVELLNDIPANIAGYCVDHPRYLQLTKAQIEVFTSMKLFDGELESLLREVLQIELVKNGPWSERSMYFVRELGISIARNCQDSKICDPLINNVVNTTL